MKISIQNLKQGISKYSETIESGFLDKDYQQFYPFSFKVDVFLDKIAKDFRVKVEIKSTAKFTCDRCLTDFEKNVNLKQEQIYKTDAVTEILDEDIVNLPLDATEIDLSDLLNEMVVVNHPIKVLCMDDCKGLCVNCGSNLNENKCQCADIQVDPRWDELRKLIK